jgi:geranylgeranyl pyrophosphate synthase
MEYSNSVKSEFKWNSYLLQSSLDPLFSDQLTIFIREFEREWQTHFSNVPYKLCQLESGNRLRPIISFLGYLISESDEYLSSYDLNNIVKVGICIELIHKSSLIIDDMVDGDSLRNGKTTFHVANGQEKAIAVTSHLISKSFKLLMEVLNETNISEKTSLKCIEISFNILDDMSTGLLKELSMDKVDFSDLKMAEEIIRNEAASIIKNSLLIGYILRRGNNPLMINYLSEIGESCGYIFQVMNDIEPYKRGRQYKNHKGKDELEFFFNRKNIITTFMLQLMSSKEKNDFYLIEGKVEAQKILFEFFNKNHVYDHFLAEIEGIKKNISDMIDAISKEGINSRWCQNCENFISSLTAVARDRVS